MLCFYTEQLEIKTDYSPAIGEFLIYASTYIRKKRGGSKAQRSHFRSNRNKKKKKIPTFLIIRMYISAWYEVISHIKQPDLWCHRSPNKKM